MPVTYKPIGSTTLTATSASVSFTSIPSTYTDLVLTGNINSPTADYARIRINSDTASNYTRVILYGNLSSITGYYQSNHSSMFMNGTMATGRVAINICHFLNYTSDNYKLMLGRQGDAHNTSAIGAFQWKSTAAITAIAITPGNATSGDYWQVGSSFSLYGILKA